MKVLIALTLLAAGTAFASPLPMPSGYPTLLGASCGGVQVTTYIVGFNADHTITGEVYAWTRCGGSGRGSGYTTRLIYSYHTLKWDFFGHYLVADYDGGALVDNVAVDEFGNVATAINGVPDLTVQVIPPGAASVALTVPSVIGMLNTDAQAALVAAGFLWTEVDSCQNAYPNPYVVFDQFPAANAVLPFDSSVSLYVSLGTVAYCDNND